MKAPTELDSARVILYIDNKATNNFGFIQFEDHRETITCLAVAKYEGSNDYYVFDCDISWNVIGDTVHSSLEEALECVNNSYDVGEFQWIKAE